MHKKLFIPLFTFYFILFTFHAYAGPASNSYELMEYGFGAGGTASSSSTNYSVNGVLGEADTGKSDSNTYSIGSGLNFTQQANVPPAPALSNPASYYNKLLLIIDAGANPDDTEFAISISSDAFVSDTKYIQNDHTVATQLNDDDWQSYATWGGGSGFEIIGLSPGTTYTVKVAARQGSFTQTQYGPTDSAATVQPSLTFDIDVSSIDTETPPPYTVAFGDLAAGSVNTASEKVWIDLDTNALNGGYVYIYGTNSGLRSATQAYTISSASTDLTGVNEGYGIRNNSATQVSGGPLAVSAPYNVASDNVGVVDTTIRAIYTSSNTPITGGRGSIVLKAKPSTITPASNDYSDILTIIASGSF